MGKEIKEALKHDGEKSRKYKITALGSLGIWAVASGALFLCLLHPPATEAAIRLGVDGAWWLWAIGVAITAITGYGAHNNWEKHIIADLMKVKLGAPEKGPESNE